MRLFGRGKSQNERTQNAPPRRETITQAIDEVWASSRDIAFTVGYYTVSGSWKKCFVGQDGLEASLRNVDRVLDSVRRYYGKQFKYRVQIHGKWPVSTLIQALNPGWRPYAQQYARDTKFLSPTELGSWLQTSEARTAKDLSWWISIEPR